MIAWRGRSVVPACATSDGWTLRARGRPEEGRHLTIAEGRPVVVRIPNIGNRPICISIARFARVDVRVGNAAGVQTPFLRDRTFSCLVPKAQHTLALQSHDHVN